MLLVFQIAGGILLALVVYRGTLWLSQKIKERAIEEQFVSDLAAEIRLEREGEGDFLRSTPKKD